MEKIYDILFVANIQKEKGIEILIEAVRILHNKGISVKVCILGGFRDDKYKTELYQLIKDYNITDNIQFAGIAVGDAKWLYFNKSKIFCLPTFYPTEAMPVTFLEAMAAGLPIITTKWRSNAEVVQDRINGILVEPENAESLSIGIEKLFFDSTLLSDISAANLKEIKKYSVPEYIGKVEYAMLNTLGIE